MRTLITLTSALALTACGMNGTDRYEEEGQKQSASPDDNLADTMASNDDATDHGLPDSEDRPIMQAQVVLDRIGFGPGVIDGEMGESTKNALLGFQEANAIPVTGELDEATGRALSRWKNIPATRIVTIPAEWGEVSYKAVPDDPGEQAEMNTLGYGSLDERLAERFHTTVDVLKMLNPNGRPATTASGSSATAASATTSAAASPVSTPSAVASADDASATASVFRPGQQIRVPNIGGDRVEASAASDKNWQQTLVALGVGTKQPQVDRIVVSKSKGTLRAFDNDKLVALFSVTSGSSQFPLPIGEWKILGEAYNPPYSYDPAVLGKGAGKTYELPPGPNSPVGVVWIDLSKEHYGIHGTPDPETIGRAESSGCVRLTNWDAARLAGMVSQETRVVFET